MWFSGEDWRRTGAESSFCKGGGIIGTFFIFIIRAVIIVEKSKLIYFNCRS